MGSFLSLFRTIRIWGILVSHFVINILFVYSQEDPLASAPAISFSGLTTDETLGASSDSSNDFDHPATFKECPGQDLSIQPGIPG